MAIFEYKLYALVATDIVGSALPAVSDAPAPVFKERPVRASIVFAQIRRLESLETPMKWNVTYIYAVLADLCFQPCDPDQNADANRNENTAECHKKE